MQAENRREHRQRVFKRATVVLSGNQSEIPCTVRNQTTSGAELKVSAELSLPPEFLVYIPVDGVAYRAAIRWRKDDRVGVEFVGKAPKPRFHYG